MPARGKNPALKQAAVIISAIHMFKPHQANAFGEYTTVTRRLSTNSHVAANLQKVIHVTVTRRLSTNSHVAANLQKIIHVLVGLLVKQTRCQLLLWRDALGKLNSNGVRNMVSEIAKK